MAPELVLPERNSKKRRASDFDEKEGEEEDYKKDIKRRHGGLVLPGRHASSATIDHNVQQTPATMSSPITQAFSPALPPGLTPSGGVFYSPYGESYSATYSSNAHQLRHRPMRCGLRIGGVAFEDAKLALPQGLDASQNAELRSKIQQELRHQADNPPILPDTEVQGLPPKEAAPPFFDLKQAQNQVDAESMRSHNAAIAEQQAARDRERNNMAAKKSRETRIEALKNTRVILNDKTAECAWLRVKILVLGGSPDEWDSLSQETKQRIIEEIDTRVKTHEQHVAEGRKKEDTKVRAERTRARQARGQQLGTSMSPESRQSFLSPTPPVSSMPPQVQFESPQQSGFVNMDAVVHGGPAAMAYDEFGRPIGADGAIYEEQHEQWQY